MKVQIKTKLWRLTPGRWSQNFSDLPMGFRWGLRRRIWCCGVKSECWKLSFHLQAVFSPTDKGPPRQIRSPKVFKSLSSGPSTQEHSPTSRSKKEAKPLPGTDPVPCMVTVASLALHLSSFLPATSDLWVSSLCPVTYEAPNQSCLPRSSYPVCAVHVGPPCNTLSSCSSSWGWQENGPYDGSHTYISDCWLP